MIESYFHMGTIIGFLMILLGVIFMSPVSSFNSWPLVIIGIWFMAPFMVKKTIEIFRRPKQ